MVKRWRLHKLILGGLALLVLPYLGFIAFLYVALHILEAKYDGLRAGLTVEETDRIVGDLFRARTMRWDEIPEIYTEGYVERTGSVVRDYGFLGLSDLNIVVIYDEEGFVYLKIPCYE